MLLGHGCMFQHLPHKWHESPCADWGFEPDLLSWAGHWLRLWTWLVVLSRSLLPQWLLLLLLLLVVSNCQHLSLTLGCYHIYLLPSLLHWLISTLQFLYFLHLHSTSNYMHWPDPPSTIGMPCCAVQCFSSPMPPLHSIMTYSLPLLTSHSHLLKDCVLWLALSCSHYLFNFTSIHSRHICTCHFCHAILSQLVVVLWLFNPNFPPYWSYFFFLQSVHPIPSSKTLWFFNFFLLFLLPVFSWNIRPVKSVMHFSPHFHWYDCHVYPSICHLKLTVVGLNWTRGSPFSWGLRWRKPFSLYSFLFSFFEGLE